LWEGEVKSRSLYFLILLLVMLSILAYFLRDTVQEWIIIPMARLFWLVKGYYGAFPQAAYWMIALGVAIVISIFSFRLPDEWKREKSRQGKPMPGAVQEMAFWIQRSKGGIFPKWHIAHFLADLVIGIINRKGTDQKYLRRLGDLDTPPPPDVEKYLSAALTTNYTDYLKPRRFGPEPATPFDQDLEPIVSYLESLMENDNDHHA
jgi:hypothetical protein